MSSKDGKIQTLVIRGLTMKDTGVYTCKIGDRHTEANLTVNESKSTLSLLLLANYLRRHLASGEGIVRHAVTLRVCPPHYSRRRR